jgi:hypothetical protein
MSYINVNTIFSYTNPAGGAPGPTAGQTPGTIRIPWSPLLHGFNCDAIDGGSHAQGEGSKAYGSRSHAEGYRTEAFGDYSHSEGYETKAHAEGSHAEGYRTEVLSGTSVTGKYAHAEGGYTNAQGQYSHAEGSSTNAIGNTSHAEGKITTSTGINSHAEGLASESIGNASHAEGQGTIASGDFSHSEGFFTQSIGEGSHAEGYRTTANGIYSHSQGYWTTTDASYQTVVGKYNSPSNVQGAFIVGNGIANNVLNNLLVAAGNEVEIFGNIKTETIQVTDGATAGYVLTSDASGNGTWQSVAGASDTYVISSTLNGTDLEINRNNGQPQIVVDLSPLSSGDVFTTGATYDNGTSTATFNRNDGNSYTLDLSSIDVNDTFVTDSTLSGTTLLIDRNQGEPQISVDLSSLSGVDTFVTDSTLSGTTLLIDRNQGEPQISVDLSSLTSVDTFVTDSTLSGTTLLIDRNQGEPQISVDLSSLADDTIVNGFTYSNNNLTISQNGQSDLTANISVMTGVTVNGVADFTDEVLINSTTLFGQTTWNPTGVSRASHRIDGINTPTLLDGTDGQLLHIYVADILSAGSSTVTVTSSLGFNTITFNAVGDTVTLMFNQSFGWTIVGSHNVAIS